MTLSLAEIGGIEFGVHPDEVFETSNSLLARILRDEEPTTILLLSIGNRPVSDNAGVIGEGGEIASLAFGEAENELAGGGSDESILLSDSDWCGRPDDFGAAHLEADPRIIDVGDYQERIPLFPEEDRRAVTFAASATAANDDGYFSDWQFDRTVEGQTAQMILAEENGYSRDFINIAQMRGRSVRASLKEAVFEFETVSDFFGRTPFCQDKWTGRGGSGGDAHLAGRRIQVVSGFCQNVELVLEDAAFETWRATAGEYIDLPRVMDALAPLPWNGQDFLDDLAALKAATIAPGFHARASKIGRVRTNRGGLALGRVTADILAPRPTTADILVFGAFGPAGLPSSFVNQGSFGVLPDDPVGFLARGEETVEDVFNALLRPFNGHFGPDAQGRLTVGVVNAGALDAPIFSLESDDWIDGEPDGDAPRARWAQSVTWNRNWTVMSASEIIDHEANPDVSAAQWAFAQRESETARASDSSVLQRFRLGGVDDGDEVYGPVEGYFTTEAGAQAAAESLLAWLKLRKKQWRTEAGQRFLFTRAGQPGLLTFDGMGLSTSRVFLPGERVISRRARGAQLSGLIAYA